MGEWSEDLRTAYRILKNAGFVPPEIDDLREIGELEKFLETAPESDKRAAALRKLQALRMRPEPGGRRGEGLRPGGAYFARLLDRLA